MSVQKSILLSYDKYVRWLKIVKDHSALKNVENTNIATISNEQTSLDKGGTSDTGQSNENKYQEGISNNSMQEANIVHVNKTEQAAGNCDIIQEDPTTSAQKLQTDIILSCIAKNLKSKARAIISYICVEESPLSWNRVGEISVNGNVICNTHIADLIRDTLKSYVNFNPTGANAYYKALSKCNIPSNLVGNSKRLSEIEHYKREALSPIDTAKSKEPENSVQVGSGVHSINSQQPLSVETPKPKIIFKGSIKQITNLMKHKKVRLKGVNKKSAKKIGWIKIT